MNTAFIPAISTVSSRHTFAGTAVCQRLPSQQAQWTMGTGKFGIFSPAVIATRYIIGRKRLNKVRGKGISIHSQVITGFCTFTGAGPKMRQMLIREAKENGEVLGFLS